MRLAPSRSNRIRCHFEALFPTQTNSQLCEPDLLSNQPLKGWKVALMFGAIRRQISNDCHDPLCLQYAATVGPEIGFIASQYKSAVAGFDTRHCEEQFLEFLQNLVAVPYPSGALTGLNYGAIGRCTHDE